MSQKHPLADPQRAAGSCRAPQELHASKEDGTDCPFPPLSKSTPSWMKAFSLVRAATLMSNSPKSTGDQKDHGEEALSPRKPVFHLQRKKKKCFPYILYNSGEAVA